MALPLLAQDDTQRSAIEESVRETFKLTTTTADRKDIVTPGSIVVVGKIIKIACSTSGSGHRFVRV